MFAKPAGFNRVGFIQCFLAASFVIWLLFFPQHGDVFAWPVVPPLTAMFLGAGFILRSYFGYHLWREKDWYRLRWCIKGDYIFLGVLFVATWWHIDEMNWYKSVFDLIVAHVWAIAYTFEPLTVFLIHPREPEADAPVPVECSEGPVLPAMKNALLVIFFVGATIWALLFFNPAFADTRWPWPLNPFDARIMSAWPAACAAWAVTMYFMKDWAEIKIGVRALIAFILPLFVVWTVTFSGYDPARKNGITFGVGTGLMALLLIYGYWRQESARSALRQPQPAPAK